MREVFDLINGMAPYLILGFFLAGIMHAFIPNAIYRKYLGGNSFRSVVNAALLGIPLPLCSCGVIPTAMSLRKEGASKAATTSFLIATPQTGVDSIIATYSLMGLPFALLRPFIALTTSLISGFMVGKFEDNHTDNVASSVVRTEQSNTSFTQKIYKALNYAFVEMMQDIGKWLVVGLIIAGLITVFVPDSFFSVFVDKPFLSMLLVLAFAIPMYLCATGSIPIAVALMLKGLSPGTALVLLIAGPAVNVASAMVIGKVMGKRTLFIYLSSIIVCSILFGLGIDYLLPREWFTEPLSVIHDGHDHGVSYFNIGCFILFTVLLCNAFTQKYKHPHNCQCQDQSCDCENILENKHEFIVKGMTCNHCKANVAKTILSIDGVDNVDINMVNGNVTVYGKFNIENVVKSVKDIGFDIIPNTQIQ